MARSAQTRPPPRPVLRVQQFVDHAGATATRVRFAQPRPFGDIADDFRVNPVFAFQVYTLVPLHLEEPEPSARRMTVESTARSSSTDTNLLSLVKFLGGAVAEARAPPVFEIYAEQRPDAFACIAHQKREIAHRKAHAADPETLLIPKVELDWASDSSGKTGFCIVITSDRFKHGARHVDGADAKKGCGLLWARFKRGRSTWPFEVVFTRLMKAEIQFGSDSIFAKLYARSFSRRSIDSDVESDDSHVVQALERYCDVGANEDEDAAEALSDSTPVASLEKLAPKLSLETFSMKTSEDGATSVSNHEPEVEPDLRYLIYVPFLSRTGAQVSLEQVAKAFTASITSRIEAGKTVSFEFRKPLAQSHGAILQDFRTRVESQPDSFVGALLRLEENYDSPAFEGRLHCNSMSLRRTDNVPDKNNDKESESTRYKVLIVILRTPAVEAMGNVEYLLADAVPGLEAETECDEMILWRNDSIDETARRLDMRFED